jgi:hypothetical protein
LLPARLGGIFSICCKAAERDMVLDGVMLLEKGGGASGLWRRAKT